MAGDACDKNPFADPQDQGALGDERAFPEDGQIIWRKRVFVPIDAATLHHEAENGFGVGSDHRDVWLQRIAQDPNKGWRELIVVKEQDLQAIRQLADIAGHARQLFDLVLPALETSRILTRPVELPPVILCSAPGIGKTYLATEMAARLGTAASIISVPNQSSTGVFTGLDASWRAAKPGEIARILIKGDAAQPVVVLDEIDKATRAGEYGFVLSALHDLWERPSARRLEDDFLKLHFAADRMLWIATANALEPLLPSILDRAIVINLPAPNERQVVAIYQSIYDHLRTGYGDWFSSEIPIEVLRSLRARPPRSARKILSLAMTKAVSDFRNRLCVDDIAYAAAFAANAPMQRIGFL
jgi:ATP-dependent Lon protease